MSWLDANDGRDWQLTRDPRGEGGPGGQHAGIPPLHFRAEDDPVFGEWRRWSRGPIVLKRMIQAGQFDALADLWTIHQDAAWVERLNHQHRAKARNGRVRLALGAYLDTVGHPGAVALMVRGSEEAAGRTA